MAGGIGSRFWPMSTPAHPKQFLDVLGIGKSLIRMTYDRLLSIAPAENIFVVTNTRYTDLVAEQIPEMDRSHILTEPKRKNTAPCIAYAAAKIHAIDPNATLIITPSDHLILKEQRFTEIIEIAVEQANSDERLVTLGIQPSRPDTGYGYIEFSSDQPLSSGSVTPVIHFREKPNLKTAENFLLSGNFYWNSGIFIWKTKTVLDALKRFTPDLHNLFTAQLEKYNTPQEQVYVDQCFEDCEDISIDYAIMEKAKNVYVRESLIGWSDLGTWNSAYENMEKDYFANAVASDNVIVIDATKCMINAPKDKLVVVQGLDDFIVVDTKDVLLICSKEKEQSIKEYVAEVKRHKGDKYI
mgnify:CR=1 FL=1